MKPGRAVLLAVCALLFSVSLFLAQAAFTGQRTVLAHAYLSARLSAALSALDDPEVHRRTVDGALGALTTAFDVRLPTRIQPHLAAAARESLSPAWIRRTVEWMHFNTQMVLNRRESRLSLPVTIGGLRTAFLQRIATVVSVAEFAAVEREIGAIPASFDLADSMDAQTMRRVLLVLRNLRSIVWIVTYLVPAALLLACLSFLRIGSALTAIGAAATVSGIAGIAVSRSAEWPIGALLAERTRAALPTYLDWLVDGLSAVVVEVVAAGLHRAVGLAIAGALVAAMGILAIARFGDPVVRLGE